MYHFYLMLSVKVTQLFATAFLFIILVPHFIRDLLGDKRYIDQSYVYDFIDREFRWGDGHYIYFWLWIVLLVIWIDFIIKWIYRHPFITNK